MRLQDAVKEVATAVAGGFNAYLESVLDPSEYHPLRYFNTAPNIESDTYSMGIYVMSSDGIAYTGNGETETTYVTFDCILDHSREGSTLPEKYLSALIDFVNQFTFGEVSSPSTGVLSRVDLDGMGNAFALDIEIVFRHMRDVVPLYDGAKARKYF